MVLGGTPTHRAGASTLPALMSDVAVRVLGRRGWPVLKPTAAEPAETAAEVRRRQA